MVHLFCEAKHGTKKGLCPDCTALLAYAEARLDHCPFGDKKPVCRNCEIHCYQAEMRAKIAEVMRFAGPRMLKKNPLSALRHLLHAFRRN